MIPMGFYGDVSKYVELPKPDEIYDYEKYKNPYWTRKEPKIETNNKNINFTL